MEDITIGSDHGTWKIGQDGIKVEHLYLGSPKVARGDPIRNLQLLYEPDESPEAPNYSELRLFHVHDDSPSALVYLKLRVTWDAHPVEDTSTLGSQQDIGDDGDANETTERPAGSESESPLYV